ncbi:ABC transporter permease [Desulfothermus okinawensis JCM 13304]
MKKQMKDEIIIEPKRGLGLIDLKEMLRYRDLFYFMTWRNIRTRYAQSSIGIGWAIIQPFFSMVVYTIIFGRLAKIDSNGVPYAIFSFTALVPWTYFASSLTEGTNSLVANANMLKKVYFPRIILPISYIVARLLDFIIAFFFLLLLMFWYKIFPTTNIIFLPILMINLILTAMGFSLWFTALAIQYRDVNYSIYFIVQLFMYATPVVYPTTAIPDSLRNYYAINPMVGVIEGFRSALLGTIPMPWTWIAIGTVSAFTLAFTGILYFSSRQKIFADVA